MANNSKGISVKILGKDYQVNCPEDKQHELLDAAFMLDKKMIEIHKNGRIMGIEKIAVMAALNIANDFLIQQEKIKSEKDDLEKKLTHLNDKVNKALLMAKTEVF